MSHFLRDTAYSFGFNDANGKAAQARNIFWAVALAYPATVFVIVPIDNVMAAVFDAPVATVSGKHALRVGLLGSSAGNAIGDFTGVLTGFFICGFALDDKSLSDVRKVQIAVEFSCSPDSADFDSAVIRRVALDTIGILPVFKK